MPALDMASKFSGITDLTQENEGLAMEMATSLPLLLQRENGEAVMRPGMMINWEDHSVTCSGSVPKDQKFVFPCLLILM
jgi:acetyl-CoA carboxylase carboxyltransferase component